MYKIGGEGQGHLDCSNDTIKAFLVTLLTTEHWKANPELMQDRCLRLRKALLQESKFIPSPAASAVPSVAA